MAQGNQLNAPSGTAAAYSEVIEPERSAEEIRQDIAAKRESITDTVERLSGKVQQTFDWHTYVSNYPVAALGVAVGVGFLISGILKPRNTSTERMKDALADCVEDFTSRFRSQLDSVTERRPTINQTIKAAATGLIVKGATEFVRNRVSGSYNQPEQTHNRAESATTGSQINTAEKWNQ